MCIGSTIWNGPHSLYTPLSFLSCYTPVLQQSQQWAHKSQQSHMLLLITVDGPESGIMSSWTTTPMVQWAALGRPSGTREVKKVVMKDQAEEKKPLWSSPGGPSLPSSPLSPSSSPRPSSMTRSCVQRTQRGGEEGVSQKKYSLAQTIFNTSQISLKSDAHMDSTDLRKKLFKSLVKTLWIYTQKGMWMCAWEREKEGDRKQMEYQILEVIQISVQFVLVAPVYQVLQLIL